VLASALVEIDAFFDVFMELTELLEIPREECSDAFCGAKHGSSCSHCSSNYEYREGEFVERVNICLVLVGNVTGKKGKENK
jgi:energy-converting hydrogenase A subunit M